MKLVHTVNIGALSAWYQYRHREDYKRLVPLMYTIMDDMLTNIGSLIVAREIFELYIKDEALTKRTVLHFLSKEMANHVYNDSLYGMGNNFTLKEWIIPTWDSGRINEKPKYIEIRDYFGLTPTDMRNIYDPVNSVFMKLVAMGKRNS